MFERLTDRARKVMALANQEAQRFNHEYIGTEHILLGLVKEGSGVGANVLKNLDIDLRKVRLEVEKLVEADDPLDLVEGREVDHVQQQPGALQVAQEQVAEAGALGGARRAGTRGGTRGGTGACMSGWNCLAFLYCAMAASGGRSHECAVPTTRSSRGSAAAPPRAQTSASSSTRPCIAEPTTIADTTASSCPDTIRK